ncbi:sensor histidine kinase [Desulfocurvus vexinensis]|uniref:sensor histidine kinase n=1 Tax=Desulfocurvus vexinensis TaxID=399548 RepID=UPI000490EC80|nr:histidine kinase dimerization/phosphoacceptor domain -containing protein [Desulfocurvus vexinensis]
MSDILLDSLRTLILVGILAALMRSGTSLGMRRFPGWRAIVAGFGLLAFGSSLDALGHFPQLMPQATLGNESVAGLLERVVGVLGGVCLIGWGLWRGLPTVAATQAGERELFRLKERYRIISAMTSDLNIDAVVEPDGSLRVEWISGSLHSDSGYTANDIMTFEQWHRVVEPEDRPLLESHIAAAVAGQPRNSELRARTRDGRVLWLALSTSASQDPGTSVRRLTTAVRDITARKLAEERTLRSLEENKVLLRELHHRVKNNLQVITGLLELAKSRIKDKDPEVLEACQDLHAKIGCMALVHTQLCADTAQGHVDFGAYARSLAAQAADIHGRPQVRLDLDLQEVPLDIDTAVPCGLALNELLTAAFKRAASGAAQRIAVEVRAQGGQMLVRVSDDGAADAAQGDGMGMRLLHNLVTLQLHGSIEFSPGPGTTATMRLPLERDADGFPLPSGPA